MNNLTTLGLLLFLTILTALSSGFLASAGFLVPLLLLLAVMKQLLVAFQFMELKKAHIFWKSLIVVFSIFFFTAISLLVK